MKVYLRIWSIVSVIFLLVTGVVSAQNGCGCLPCNLTLHFTAERCAPLSQALSAWDFHPSSHLFHEWVNSRSSSRLRASSLESVIMGCSQWDKYKEVRGLAICVSQGFFCPSISVAYSQPFSTSFDASWRVLVYITKEVVTEIGSSWIYGWGRGWDLNPGARLHRPIGYQATSPRPPFGRFSILFCLA